MIDLPEEMEAAYTEEELIRTWGWLVSERFNLGDYKFSAREIEVMVEGLRANIQGKPAPTDVEVSVNQMQEYFAARELEIRSRVYVKNQQTEQAFFDNLFGQPGVKELGTGLRYEVLVPGTGKKPGPRSEVMVNYEGRLLDGTIFDSSAKYDEPAQFRLDGVIPAWQQGLQLIGEGGKIRLYVPNKLAYGREGRPSIPSGAALIFEVELVKVVDFAPTGPIAPPAPAANPEAK